MKAFTVYPWWGWAMVALGKAVENRSYRPPLSQGEWVAIHAGNRKLAGGRAPNVGDLAKLIADAGGAGWDFEVFDTGSVLFRKGGDIRDVAIYQDFQAPRSAIVAVAQYNGAFQGVPMPWGHSTGFQWRLTSVMPLTRPVPIRGAQGLWAVPDGALERMRGQVPDAVFGGEVRK